MFFTYLTFFNKFLVNILLILSISSQRNFKFNVDKIDNLVSKIILKIRHHQSLQYATLPSNINGKMDKNLRQC